MKDRVEIAIVLRTDEISGKGLKAVGLIVKKIEPQIIRVVEAITKYTEREFEADEKSDSEVKS